MNETMLSYYDTHRMWENPGHEFLIRGFALQETMPPVLIQNGEKSAYPWPWLFMFFEDPVVLNAGTEDETECENALMIWPNGASHHYGNKSKNWTHSWLIADDPEMEQFLKKYPLPIGRPLCTDAGRIFAKYLPLFHSEIFPDGGDCVFLKSLFFLFLYDLYRQCRHNFIPIPPRVQEMERYLAEHLMENLTVEQIASHFNLSIPHFTALFRKYYHSPPMNYLNTLRMNLASRLLSLYPYSCKEIAERTGFVDSLYFSKRFHHFYGVSPREYRKRTK